jgi:hypothetical protein
MNERKVKIEMSFEFFPKSKAEEQNMIRCLHTLYEGIQAIPGIGNAGYSNPNAEHFEPYWAAREHFDKR